MIVGDTLTASSIGAVVLDERVGLEFFSGLATVVLGIRVALNLRPRAADGQFRAERNRGAPLSADTPEQFRRSREMPQRLAIG